MGTVDVNVVEDASSDSEEPVADSKYAHLPARVRLEDTIATQAVDPHPEADLNRDAERDFMLRYAG
jgi:hypothetical protein